ncbi:efflux RND transporter periplasmic adaptor subunit [Lacinutrix sp. WUR7]|uniref:efflux RND transporter periplasmic adaptor subunit n=1 Tax=Lacinutrix sp. WUR7 TaxID=2653681 RepID=UPI00193CBD13|nr:efflux RND transporter periplasmic adaptor subunit [Lacinutrix sp. WUR7]QRM90308.1 efflux RND transporter periplasmic adaptor subunit [Lacinutrix sp. WUR7]
MKKYILYIAVLAVGLLLGAFLFGDSSNKEVEHKHNEIVENSTMWTCSMHPQIMQSEPGDCPICGMDLIPVKSNSDGLLADQFKLSENAMALANIQTSMVGTSSYDADSGFVLSGKITENENETATMPAHFDGRIEKLYVNSLGEQVRKGQAIAKIYSPDLVAAQQELITAYKLKATQPQLYNAVKNKFKNWMIHGPQLEEVEQSGQVKTSFTIYSHVSGVVTEIAINEGSHIMDGKPIFKVSNLNTVWANFDVYENQISQVKKGQAVVVTTNAYPDKTFNGKVDFIDPILDTKTRTVKLRVVLNNKEGVFKPGMFVEGKLKAIANATNEEEVLTIPASAVLWTGKRSVVYVKTNPTAPVFEMREITIGNQIGSNYPVLEGLQKEDEIVTNGTFTVDAAAQLQGKKSMMNTSNTSASKPAMEVMKMTFPAHFQKEFKEILPMYLKMKDAFIVSDGKTVSDIASTMYQKTQNFDSANLGKVELVHFNKTRSMLKAISENNEIEKQRAHFVILNENIVALTMNMGTLDTTLYVQKCPMANNNNGAMWLSNDKDIRNPYYGDAMITCGSVIEEIK